MFSVEQLVANVFYDKLKEAEQLLKRTYYGYSVLSTVDEIDYENLPHPADALRGRLGREEDLIRMIYAVSTLSRLAYEMDFEDSELIAYPSYLYKYVTQNYDWEHRYSCLTSDFSVLAIIVIWALKDDLDGGSKFLHDEWRRVFDTYVSVEEMAVAQNRALIEVES